MINILFAGNSKVFDGALTELISITNRTKEDICAYIFTMDATNLNKDYTSISEEDCEFLDDVVKKKNSRNAVKRVDVTSLYKKEFSGSKNENAYCTPYTLLRLLADLIPEIPDKILYLDLDMMAGGDVAKLYNTNIEDYEYAAVKEKYGCWIIRPDYINAGMLLLNMKKIKETKLLEKAREKIRNKKMIFADQDAIFWSTTKKKILPRIYNEQSKFNKKDTVICHFAKRMVWVPYPRTENIKQWHIDKVHKIYKCHVFDKDLEEYLEEKEKYLKGKEKNEKK